MTNYYQNNVNNQYSTSKNFNQIENDTKSQQLITQQYPKIVNIMQFSNMNNLDVSISNKPSLINSYFKSIDVPEKFNERLIKKLMRSKRFFVNNLNQNQKVPDFQLKRARVPFTKEEDEKIKELVNIFGCGKWNLVSHFMERRTAKQCRDRYTNYLTPGVFQGEWMKEEDELLYHLYKKIGPKWSIMQRCLPSRTATNIKNRWIYFLSKQNNFNMNGEIVEVLKNNDECKDKENFEEKNSEIKDKDCSCKLGNEIVENKNSIFDFDNDWIFNDFFVDQKAIIDK